MSFVGGGGSELLGEDSLEGAAVSAASRRQRSDRRFVSSIRQKLKDAEAIVDLEIFAAEVWFSVGACVEGTCTLRWLPMVGLVPTRDDVLSHLDSRIRVQAMSAAPSRRWWAPTFALPVFLSHARPTRSGRPTLPASPRSCRTPEPSSGPVWQPLQTGRPPSVCPERGGCPTGAGALGVCVCVWGGGGGGVVMFVLCLRRFECVRECSCMHTCMRTSL
jgi:hypothetical protein